jgi:rhodanese-related sulfurtransferase
MPKWPEVWLWLNEEKRMRTLDSAEAAKMCFGGGKRNAVLLDVRFEPDYEKWSIPGSVHVPYVTGGVLAKMRLPGFKKKNVDFVSQVERLVPDKNTEIVLACIWGGSLVREPPKNRGLTDDTKGAGVLAGGVRAVSGGVPEPVPPARRREPVLPGLRVRRELAGGGGDVAGGPGVVRVQAVRGEG